MATTAAILAPSLRTAASGGYTELVEVLLKKYKTADPEDFLNATDNEGCTALYLAASGGHTGVVELLLNQKSIDPIKSNKKKWTPLRAALSNDNAEAAEAAELLLEHDKVKGTTELNGDWNALAHASSSGYIHVVRLLLSDPDVARKVDEQDADGFTALYLASKNGHARVVKQLLKSSANINKESRGRLTAIYAASAEGHSQVVEILIRHQAKLNIATKEGETPLMSALIKGHAGVVDLLMEALESSPTADKTVLTQDNGVEL